jgi:hypothetical protein
MKLVEVFVLYNMGARALACVAGATWATFSLGALVLIALGKSREDDGTGVETDVLVGQLPTPTSVGGECRVMLGLPKYTRHSLAWTCTWIVGAAMSIAALMLYYILLGKLEQNIFYTWAGFHVLWLIARMIYFHLSNTNDSLISCVLVKQTWENLSSSYRARIRNLAWGLSTHLMEIHPRRRYSYEEDTSKVSDLGNMLETYPLSGDPESEVLVDVVSVIGDTLLASVCWVAGEESGLTGSALYDSCIVEFRVDEKTISVPAARVLTGVRPKGQDDQETGPPRMFPPRGGSNVGPSDLTWVYWIPCEKGLWLQFKSQDLSFLGKRTAELMNDSDLRAKLNSDEVFISLREVEEVKEIIRTSRQAWKAVSRFMI